MPSLNDFIVYIYNVCFAVYSPAPNAFKQKIHSLPELHDEFLAKKLYDGNVPEGHYVVNGAPSSKNVITYMIKEYNPLLDSSNMSIDDWTRIATDIYVKI